MNIRKFLYKNKGNITGAIYDEVISRCYSKSLIRHLFYPFIQLRTPEQWVFIVGCYNSGTTLTRDILGCHPEIEILPREGVRFTKYLPRPEDLGWTRMWIGCPEYMQMPNKDQRKIVNRIIRDWSPLWGKKGSVYLEKSISNITRMEWINENFNRVKFIGIIRDGYPVSEGIRRRAKPGKNIKKLYPNGYPIELAGKQWVIANQTLLNSSTKVNDYLQIKYEDLIEDPTEILQDIYAYIGVNSPKIQRKSEELVINKSCFNLTNKNKESIDRLTTKDISLLTPVISDMQEKLGYTII